MCENAKKRPALIDEVLTRLETTEIVKPDTALKGREKIVGTLPEELQRLASLRLTLGNEYDTMVESAQAEIEAIDSRKEQAAAVDRLSVAISATRLKHDAVKDWFWNEVRLAFPELIGKDHIGIGPEFEAYWLEPEEDEHDCPSCRARHGLLGTRVIGPIHLPGLSAILNGIFQEAPDEQPERKNEEPPTDGKPEATGEEPPTEAEEPGFEPVPGDGSQHA